MLTGIQKEEEETAGCMAALGTSALGALGERSSTELGLRCLRRPAAQPLLAHPGEGGSWELAAGWLGQGTPVRPGPHQPGAPEWQRSPTGPQSRLTWSHGWQTGTGRARPGGAGGGGSPERRTLRPRGGSGWGWSGPSWGGIATGRRSEPCLGHWGSQALQGALECLQTRRGVCPSARGRGQGTGALRAQRSPKLRG